MSNQIKAALWMLLIFTQVVMLLLVIGVSKRANAHTLEEQQEWKATWLEEMLHDHRIEPYEMAELQAFLWANRPRPVILQARPAQAASPAPVSQDVQVSSIEINFQVEQWRGLVASYPGWDVDRMLRIMDCESGGNPWAKNPRSSATGLFQVMASIWHDGRDLYDPYVNIDVAHYVWTEQGYRAWVCKG